MLFVFHAIDKPDHFHVRRANMDAHVAYLKGAETIKVLLAGPILSDDHEAVAGSMLVVEAANEQAVKTFFDGDPYKRADLFATTSLRPWKKTVGWNAP